MAAACRRLSELPRVNVVLTGACSRCFSSSVVCLNAKDGEPAQFKPPPKPVIVDKLKPEVMERRFLSPEFIPPQQRTKEKVLNIPEFYVGSIVSVTTAVPYASGKKRKFVGICIQRPGKGLSATFVLRNVIEEQGVEIRYELYSPLIQEIKVLKLEKRLDDDLTYLRNALPEYSTVDVNMMPVPYSLTDEVPLKVIMKPKPWLKRWERPQFKIQGIRFDLCLTEEKMKKAKKWDMPWIEFDMLKEYDTSELEKRILEEVNRELKK
uniref:Large ribosomal subunit protein bL19m n=1 Tax=Sphenodon punctatus TaxID=8508 RepID=A0A8D0L2D0_SPHPU